MTAMVNVSPPLSFTAPRMGFPVTVLTPAAPVALWAGLHAMIT
jgi:hypothetical protein